MAKPKYEPPASQVDLDERQKNGNENPHTVLSTYSDEAPEDDGNARDFAVEGNKTGAYLGTSPEYQNYADPRDKPLRAESGPEKKVEDEVYGNKDGNEPEDESEEDEDDDEKQSDPADDKSDPQGGATPTPPNLAGNSK